MASTTKVLLNKFLKLDAMIKRKEGETKTLKQELEPIEAELLGRFQNEGTASIKTASGSTVYINRQLWASGVDEDKTALNTILKELDDTKDIVKEQVNAQTLSAYVREKIDEHFGEDAKKKSPTELLEALPEGLRSVLKVTEVFSLKARRSS